MTACWELIRTDAEQPWHARLISNGRVITSTETYARQIGAERAILAVVRAHDIAVAGMRWSVPGVEKVMVGAGVSVLGWLPVVAYRDERSGR
jgi:uncharacterized protein YegP (UPF0339 family)